MALKKNPKYDIKRKYYRVLQISFIVSLSLLILAFKTFPDLKVAKVPSELPPDIPVVVDIPPTERDSPPPPPRPPIPIEASIDDLPDDIEMDPTDLDVDVDVPPPPPPPKVDDEEEIPIFIAVADVLPEPIGGVSAIQRKIVYPEIAKRAGVQGRVFVKAYVDEKGNVKKVELVKGIGAGCDEEALSAVKNSLFNPGQQRGRNVKVQVTIPVLFKLQ